MKIISQQLIRSLGISPRECVDWIYDSFAQKAEAQLPAKISVHPAETDFFTSMPCLLPPSADGSVRYFGVKEVHRIAGAVPSLGSDLLLYNALNGELLALLDADYRVEAVQPVDMFPQTHHVENVVLLVRRD